MQGLPQDSSTNPRLCVFTRAPEHHVWKKQLWESEFNQTSRIRTEVHRLVRSGCEWGLVMSGIQKGQIMGNQNQSLLLKLFHLIESGPPRIISLI
jgi:hypothetical protein